MLGIAFLVIGVSILLTSNSIQEYDVQYDSGFGSTHRVEIRIDEKMEPPIYFYYELEGFFANHRRFVKSRSDSQLRGVRERDVIQCTPLEKYGGDILYPCGLIANSFFNDTFRARLRRSDGSTLDLSDPFNNNAPGNPKFKKRGIAWDSDADTKFKGRPLAPFETNVSSDGHPLPAVGDEDFMVWMRTAALSTFRKLYRKIETVTFQKNDTLVVEIDNEFPVASFNGKKRVLISTTAWIGGKQNVLSISYIVVGSLALLFGMVYFGALHGKARELGSFDGWDDPLRKKPSDKEQQPSRDVSSFLDDHKGNLEPLQEDDDFKASNSTSSNSRREVAASQVTVQNR